MTVKDFRPYLINAYVTWLEDSGQDPHIMIQNMPGVVLPASLASDEFILLNVSAQATNALNISDSGVTFQTRFNGQVFDVVAPIDSVLLVRSRDGLLGIRLPTVETPAASEGTSTNVEQPEAAPAVTFNVIKNSSPIKQEGPRSKPVLKVIK